MPISRSKPMVVRPNRDPLALERVPLSSSLGENTYDEAFIQNLVFEHPSCLPIAEIDRAYEFPVPVCRELNTFSGPLDVLYVTPTGRLVILEAKLWRNPEARRKVVAQILDYAQELSRWDYEDLQREVAKRLGLKGNILYDLVAQDYPGTDEAQFVDEVQQSLRRGRFLLLILGDGIREGAGSITDFLESFGTLEFTFGLVELAIYSGLDEGLLVYPKVVARTVEIGRTVISLAPGMVVEETRNEEPGSSSGPSELERFYLDFWGDLLAGLELDDASQPVPNSANSRGNIFFAMPPSGGTAWITAFFSQASRETGAFLTFTRGNYGDNAYARLESDRAGIDRELDLPVDWSSVDGKHRISLMRRFDDLRSTENREEIKNFLGETINRFVNVFRPRLEEIAEGHE